MNTEELEIPVPWGHIAAKAWGNKEDLVVLAFHGLLDNAGTFDRLIPLLPQNYCYICFDLPGHGKSSHLPKFFPTYTINNIFAYKYIAEYFKQDRYIIIGHSYGGQIAFLFASVYPELVEKLIMLDTIHLYPVPARLYHQTLREKFDFFIDLYEKMSTRQPPTYTYEECIEKLINGRRHGSITRASAEALVLRAIIPVGDGRYKFTVDQRVKGFINPLQDFRYITECITRNPVKCPVLIILGRDSQLQQVYMKKLLKVYKKNKNIRIKIIDGGHDVHNNNPEFVSPFIIKFLNQFKL